MNPEKLYNRNQKALDAIERRAKNLIDDHSKPKVELQSPSEKLPVSIFLYNFKSFRITLKFYR